MECRRRSLCLPGHGRGRSLCLPSSECYGTKPLRLCVMIKVIGSVFKHFAQWRTLLRILLLVVAGIVVGACSATPTIIEERVVDGLTIALERPAQPLALRDYSFTATITNAADQPVDATLVYFDFTMPQMEMGVHQPIADRLGPGKYGVRTIYSMEGDWRITVVATIDGRDVRAWFDHPVLPP